MRNLNLSNYALLNEQLKFGYSVSEAKPVKADAKAAGTSAAPAAGTSSTSAAPAGGNTISVLPNDTPEVKALKELVINNVGKPSPDAEFVKINSAAAGLAADPAGQNIARTKVKIGEKEYGVNLYRAGGKSPDGKYGIYIDYDSTAEIIAGLDMNFLAQQVKKGVEGSSIFGLNFGTNEDKLAAIAGAIWRLSYERGANAPDIFSALSTAYQNAYGESLDDAIQGEFSGTNEVISRAAFGQNVTEEDIKTGMGVDFFQSLVLDVVIGVATLGAGAAVRGIWTAGKAVRAAKNLSTVQKFVKGAKAFGSGARYGTNFALTGGKLAARTGATAAGGLAVPGTATATALGDVAVAGTKAAYTTVKGAQTAAMAGAGLGVIQGASELSTDVNPGGAEMVDNLSAEDKAFAFCTQIKELAKGYTDGGDELQIAFMILSLNPTSAQQVLATWQKSFSEDGQFYEYNVSSELSGDMKTMINGYWAGITGTGPLAAQVDQISANMVKASAPTVGGGGGFTAVSESAIMSFKAFLNQKA